MMLARPNGGSVHGHRLASATSAAHPSRVRLHHRASGHLSRCQCPLDGLQNAPELQMSDAIRFASLSLAALTVLTGCTPVSRAGPGPAPASQQASPAPRTWSDADDPYIWL